MAYKFYILKEPALSFIDLFFYFLHFYFMYFCSDFCDFFFFPSTNFGFCGSFSSCFRGMVRLFAIFLVS